MPTYTSPEAGEIEAPDGFIAAMWLMHRHAHALYGDRAIYREFQAYPLDYQADHWTASAWIGAPVPGDGRLDFAGIYVYSLPDYQLQSEYYDADSFIP